LLEWIRPAISYHPASAPSAMSEWVPYRLTARLTDGAASAGA